MKTLGGAVEDAICSLRAEVQAGELAGVDQALDPGVMTDIISHQSIHEPDLRQQLLEMESISVQIPLICEFLRKISTAAED